MEHINFSKNWNNKLDCEAFTTLRMPNERYKTGQVFEITLNEESKGCATLVAITYINLEDITEYIARLDTGCSAEDCKNLIRDIYPKADFTQQRLAYLLFVKSKDN
ncbi:MULTISPECIES: hypothetical protein [Sphingobacterium]|uniref:Uncharacterized protein n=1 Tax=Sphingobacterium kitahiroshimense TaxID=470446 RepID=A0ABV0C153_9SPHI|nr:hypothetical protein [Sphingobacterium sp. JUb56]MBB2950896.1 uncharacterized protein YqfB (UPF0267 family) [Sphingobacterium sp. JUb56]